MWGRLAVQSGSQPNPLADLDVKHKRLYGTPHEISLQETKASNIFDLQVTPFMVMRLIQDIMRHASSVR